MSTDPKSQSFQCGLNTELQKASLARARAQAPVQHGGPGVNFFLRLGAIGTLRDSQIMKNVHQQRESFPKPKKGKTQIWLGHTEAEVSLDCRLRAGNDAAGRASHHAVLPDAESRRLLRTALPRAVRQQTRLCHDRDTLPLQTPQGAANLVSDIKHHMPRISHGLCFWVYKKVKLYAQSTESQHFVHVRGSSVFTIPLY